MSSSSSEPIRQFVRAGAGAGKTYSLTREVIAQALNFYDQEGRWPKIVLTTFTRKATQELKERLLVYCLEEKPEALPFVQSSSYLTITTMHGLFNLFLSRKSSTLGMPSRFRIVDGRKGNFWRRQILLGLLSESDQYNSLKIFDLRRIMEHLRAFEPVYWSGDGETLTHADDFNALFDETCRDWARELDGILNEASQQVDGEKWEAHLSALDKLKELLITPQTWEQRRSQGQGLLTSLSKPRKSKNTPGLADDLNKRHDSLIKDLKKWLIEPEFAPEHWDRLIAIHSDFQNLGQKYMKALYRKKVEEASLEPDDLEFFSLKILNDNPEVIEQFSREVDSWFIDEFQDTSPLQLKILERMIGHQSCYIVGDPQQSIYLFRGSRSEVFFDKQKRMEEAGDRYQLKINNYRSQANLLYFFNQFFTSLADSFTAMEPTQDPLTDDASVLLTLNTSDDDSVEIAEITKQIAELLQKGVSPKEICILTRVHKDIDRLQKILMAKGFPVMSHSSAQFYQRREILDALGFLQFLLNPWDDNNLIMVMSSPWMGLPDELIVELSQTQPTNRWLAFQQWFKDNPEHHQGQILLGEMQARHQQGVSLSLQNLLFGLDVFSYSQKIDGTGRREANLWKLVNLVERNAREPGSNLLQLVREGAAASGLEDFGDASDASAPVAPDKINLMTIHASKGLQFEYVFLPFLNKKPRATTFKDFTFDQERKLWSIRTPLLRPGQPVAGVLEQLFVKDMKRRESEESLRVFYVAMTRAKKQVYMSWTGEAKAPSWGEMVYSRLPALQKIESFSLREISESQGGFHPDQGQQVLVPTAYQELLPPAAVSQESDDFGRRKFANWEQLRQSEQTRRRGIILHRIFENLQGHGLETAVAVGLRWLPGEEKPIRDAIQYMYDCEELPFADILKHGQVEWSYQIALEDRVKERRVDLWAVVGETLWVVDYKTGDSSLSEKAFEQIHEYTQALSRHLNWQGPVEQVAVYPFSKKIFRKSLRL